MDSFEERYPYEIDENIMAEEIANAKASATNLAEQSDVLKLLFSCIDLTTLSTEDSSDSVRDFVTKVNELTQYFESIPPVAAMCVFPVFAPVLKSGLKNIDIKRAVVAAGFPSSQTFSDVKKLEVKHALDFGANEIDIVMSVGEFLEGNFEFVGAEINMIKSLMGDIHLKVILETGALKNDDIWLASFLAMENDADFIKTSTGKQQPAATLEAAYIMLKAIKKYHQDTGKKVGFKPAGGISTTQDALCYYALVKEILGEEWLNNELFRIGASRLANNLIMDILEQEKGFSKEIKYF